MEYDYIEELLLMVKEYCEAHRECEECPLFIEYGCYLTGRIPEQYFEENDE